jgi:uncharacterized protein YheU (UPF0270 family)
MTIRLQTIHPLPNRWLFLLSSYRMMRLTACSKIEKDLDAQLAVARKQLTKGRVLIIFDPVTERCQIIESELLQQWQAAKTSND